METTQLQATLSALLFAAEEPLSAATLALLLEETGVDKKTIAEALEELQKKYNEDPAQGLMLREVAGGYQWVTKPELSVWIQKLNAPKPKSLSQAALETLAIVAYRQPVIRPEIEEIRGVDSGGVLKTLLERGWIRIVGRRDEPGTPLIYGTTPAFLELFNLKNLEELPSLKSIEEIADTQRDATDPFPGDETLEESMDVSRDDDEEEQTETIPSAGDEDEVLEELETQMKTLRQLEKEMFPKPEVQEAGAQPETPATEEEKTVPEPE